MTCRMSEPEAKEAVDWIRARIWDDESWVNNTEMSALGVSGDSAQLFATGVFSMMEADIEFWPSLADNVPLNWDIMHVPTGPAGASTWATTTPGASTRVPQTAGPQ